MIEYSLRFPDGSDAPSRGVSVPRIGEVLVATTTLMFSVSNVLHVFNKETGNMDVVVVLSLP